MLSRSRVLLLMYRTASSNSMVVELLLNRTHDAHFISNDVCDHTVTPYGSPLMKIGKLVL